MLITQVQEAAIFKEEKTHSGLKDRSRSKSATRRQEGRNGIAKISTEMRGKVVPMDKATRIGEGRGTQRGAEQKEKWDAESKQWYELLISKN